MAGAVKHMERSRRSHNNNNGFIFSQFSRKAYTNKYLRDQNKSLKMTLGQKLSASIKKMMPQNREG